MKKKDNRLTNPNLAALLDLMQANPHLPVVPMVHSEVVEDNGYAYWMGSWGTARIDEFITTDDGVFFKGDDDPDGDFLFSMIDSEKIAQMTIPELEAAYDALPWKKAIIVYIGTPEEE